MSEERPSLEQLNAYVDGELSTRQASNVARAISDDWELANRVATLSRLKAVVQETFGSDRDGGIALPAEAAASGARPQVVKPVLAAALALVLFIGATSWLHLSGQPASKPWLNRAWALHQAWSAKPVVQADAPSAGLVLAALGHLEPELMNIDLAAARLRLTLAEEFVGTTGTRGLHLGYEG